MIAVWEKWERVNGHVVCKNCPIYLPNFNIIHVAHVIGKGARTDYRFVYENVMPLCFDCHREYDQGDFKFMPVMSHVYKVIDQLIEKDYREWNGSEFIHTQKVEDV